MAREIGREMVREIGRCGICQGVVRVWVGPWFGAVPPRPTCGTCGATTETSALPALPTLPMTPAKTDRPTSPTPYVAPKYETPYVAPKYEFSQRPGASRLTMVPFPPPVQAPWPPAWTVPPCAAAAATTPAHDDREDARRSWLPNTGCTCGPRSACSACPDRAAQVIQEATVREQDREIRGNLERAYDLLLDEITRQNRHLVGRALVASLEQREPQVRYMREVPPRSPYGITTAIA